MLKHAEKIKQSLIMKCLSLGVIFWNVSVFGVFHGEHKFICNFDWIELKYAKSHLHFQKFFRGWHPWTLALCCDSQSRVPLPLSWPKRHIPLFYFQMLAAMMWHMGRWLKPNFTFEFWILELFKPLYNLSSY